jgi:hypothetical protein
MFRSGIESRQVDSTCLLLATLTTDIPSTVGLALTECLSVASVLHTGVKIGGATHVTDLETPSSLSFANVARTENSNDDHDGTEVLGEHCNEISSVVVEGLEHLLGEVL